MGHSEMVSQENLTLQLRVRFLLAQPFHSKEESNET